MVTAGAFLQSTVYSLHPLFGLWTRYDAGVYKQKGRRGLKTREMKKYGRKGETAEW